LELTQGFLAGTDTETAVHNVAVRIVDSAGVALYDNPKVASFPFLRSNPVVPAPEVNAEQP
jgi:hypothetical protein